MLIITSGSSSSAIWPRSTDDAAPREGGPKRRDKREEAPSGHCGELRAVKYTPPGELWNSAPALCRPWYLGCGEIRGTLGEIRRTLGDPARYMKCSPSIVCVRQKKRTQTMTHNFHGRGVSASHI